MRAWCPRLVLLASLACAASPALAYTGPPMTAMRTGTPIVVDGVLDEPVWKTAELITGFKQRDPDQDSDPRQRTEARIAYDDDAIYIAAWLYDNQPDSIVARMGRRDGGVRSDMFVAFLDPFHDKRTGYYFGVSAAGTLIDGTLYNDGWDDDSWDAVWNARVRRDEHGWYAEMKIPFSQLRQTSHQTFLSPKTFGSGRSVFLREKVWMTKPNALCHPTSRWRALRLWRWAGLRRCIQSHPEWRRMTR